MKLVDGEMTDEEDWIGDVNGDVGTVAGGVVCCCCCCCCILSVSSGVNGVEVSEVGVNDDVDVDVDEDTELVEGSVSVSLTFVAVAGESTSEDGSGAEEVNRDGGSLGRWGG